MNYPSYKINEYVKIPEMFSLFRQHFNSDYSFGGEYHNFWECVYVINGSICASGDERVYSLNAGDIIFHKPMELHKFHISSPHGASLFIFSFSLGGDACNVLANRVFCLSEKQKSVLHSLLDYLTKNTLSTNAAFTDYIPHLYSSPTYSQAVSAHLCGLFLMLCENGSSAPVLTTSDAVIFGNAVTFLQKHICEPLSVDEIAQACCVSDTGLKRIFSKYAGMGVHKYFMQMKINKASSLLKDGMNVTEVAEALGFSEQSYFSKVYKKQTGFSPSRHFK